MIEYNKLNIDEYIYLLNSVGWKIPSLRLLEILNVLLMGKL